MSSEPLTALRDRIHRGVATLADLDAYLAAASEEPRPRSDVDRETLLRALWDCGVASGMDTDGDAGPGAMVAGMGEAGFARAMVEEVGHLRVLYDARSLAALPSPRSDDREGTR